jgi:hypothetical protein
VVASTEPPADEPEEDDGLKPAPDLPRTLPCLGGKRGSGQTAMTRIAFAESEGGRTVDWLEPVSGKDDGAARWPGRTPRFRAGRSGQRRAGEA